MPATRFSHFKRRRSHDGGKKTLIDESPKEIDVVQSSPGNVQVDVEALQKAYDDIASENEELRDDYQTLKQEHEELQLTSVTLQTENDRLKAEINEIKKQNQERELSAFFTAFNEKNFQGLVYIHVYFACSYSNHTVWVFRFLRDTLKIFPHPICTCDVCHPWRNEVEPVFWEYLMVDNSKLLACKTHRFLGEIAISTGTRMKTRYPESTSDIQDVHLILTAPKMWAGATFGSKLINATSTQDPSIRPFTDFCKEVRQRAIQARMLVE